MAGEMYDERYYERGEELGLSGYTNYRWLPELSIPLAFRLIEKLGLSTQDRILDYGCSYGYLVKALRLLGRQAYGCDVSTYALDHAPDEVKSYLFEIGDDGLIPVPNGPYTWIIAKDVLEHIAYSEIDTLLKRLVAACRYAFFIIPLGENGKYNVPEYEGDVTHVIREPAEWWCVKLEEAGFSVYETLFRVYGLKDNWTHYPKANGFFRVLTGGNAR